MSKPYDYKKLRISFKGVFVEYYSRFDNDLLHTEVLYSTRKPFKIRKLLNAL